VFRRGLVTRDPAELAATLGLDGALISGDLSREVAEGVAQAMRQETGASHALAVLITAPTASISAAASISRSPLRRGWNPAAHAFMAVAIGCVSALSSSASTACAATCKASRSRNVQISSGFEFPAASDIQKCSGTLHQERNRQQGEVYGNNRPIRKTKTGCEPAQRECSQQWVEIDQNIHRPFPFNVMEKTVAAAQKILLKVQ
jgi:hypothetical protein